LKSEFRRACRHSVCRADGEDTFPGPEVLNPLAVTAEVALAGVPQAARVSVDHTQDGQTAIRLTDDSTAERLTRAIKAYVGDARLTLGAGGECGQCHRLIRLPESEQNPARFLLTPRLAAVPGVLLEERSADVVRNEQSLEWAVFYRAGNGRRRDRPCAPNGPTERPAEVFEEAVRPINQGLELHPDLVS
jgi:hypothetical protein